MQDGKCYNYEWEFENIICNVLLNQSTKIQSETVQLCVVLCDYLIRI